MKIKMNFKNKLIIILFVVFISFFSLNKNYSKAFSTTDFINQVKKVYEMAHNNNFKYGSSGSIPPCEDGFISCDRLVCRAVWDLGLTDQPAGGYGCDKIGEFLESNGFNKIQNTDDYKPGDIISVAQNGEPVHICVIESYDSETKLCSKYDMGGQDRIDGNQPFMNVPVNEWENLGRTIYAVYRLPEDKMLSNFSEKAEYINKQINFSEGIPEKYDVFIDGDMLDAEDGFQVPIIQTSIDYLLYNNGHLSNIDFFGINSAVDNFTYKNQNATLKEKLKTKWERISSYVKSTNKVLLYIAIALMMTSFIYIGVLIVNKTIVGDKLNNILGINTVEDKSVTEEYKEKSLIEQWFKSLFTLIFSMLVITLTIGLSFYISNSVNMYNIDGKIIDSVDVYSKAVVDSSNSSGIAGLGTKKDIDSNTVDKNGNKLIDRIKPSLHGNSLDSLVDNDGSKLTLSYLEIPYYDINDHLQTGEMIVHQKLADEVLLIFQELYQIKYPIERMELVDNFDANDWKSIQANNTSAFNYRKANDGQRDLDNLSNHAYGKCIDINPLVNPYIINYHSHNATPYTTHRPEDGPNGTNSSNNHDDKFIKRNTMEGWTEVEKREKIAKDTEIYNIFIKYGWTWLEKAGSGEKDLDSQHFQKLDASNAKTIDWNAIKSSKSPTPKVSGNDATGIIFIGDSRTEGIRGDVTSNATFICKVGEGHKWMVEKAFPEADKIINMGNKVIIWLGVNDIDESGSYINSVNTKALQWTARGAKVYYAEVGPLKRDDQYATNEKIKAFNQSLKNGLSDRVTIIPLYDKLVNEGFEMVNSIDTTHYNKETNIRIYNHFVNAVTSGITGSGNSSKSTTPTPFIKYQLTDQELTGLAAVAYSEQGSLEGAAAEASLMANLFELHHNGQCHGVTGGAGLYKMVGAPRSDTEYFWFDRASTFIDTGHLAEYAGGGPVTPEMKAVVRSVLVDGKRTLPGYVDEHASTNLVQYITTNGANYDDTDKSKYIPHVTIVHQPSSSYIYYTHVADSSDPFGYTSRENREKIGDFHYDFDGNAVGNSGQQIDFYFTTNFEGLYMILSNCSWDNNLGINLFYVLCGFILTIFKAGLHYILYFRMILLGIIIAITPLIIIVDEIMKFRGNEGILKKWLVFYLKILAFRPLLQIVYTVLGKLNKTPIEENPFYIMLIVLVLTAIFVVYMFSMFKGKNKKAEQ